MHYLDNKIFVSIDARCNHENFLISLLINLTRILNTALFCVRGADPPGCAQSGPAGVECSVRAAGGERCYLPEAAR